MLFAGAAALAATIAVQNISVAKVPAHISIASVALQPVIPATPSEFEKESLMTPGELLGRWDPMIKAASQRFGVREDWIRAVMRRESGGRTMLGPDQKIVSSAGAMGLMQVMPETYAELRAEYGFGADPFNPEDNINAGAAYLRFLKAKYGFPAMLAAYNAGPGRLEQHMKGSSTLPQETRDYVTSIARYLKLETKSAKFAALLKPPQSKSIAQDAKDIAMPAFIPPKEYLDGANAAFNFDNNIKVGAREAVAQAIQKAEGAY